MDFCDKVGDWLLIFKKVDAALIEQNPLEETMLLYMAMRGRNDRSWRPCFLYFTAFMFSFFNEFEIKKRIKVLFSTLEGTASQEQVTEARSRYNLEE